MRGRPGYPRAARHGVAGDSVNTAFIELVGSAAAILTTGAFFPQAIKTLRRGETAGLSLVMYLMLVSGVLLWLFYGILLGSWPLIVANSIVIVPQLAILILLLARGKQTSQ
jgi:MtN3 and saliva related transmembrane protein